MMLTKASIAELKVLNEERRRLQPEKSPTPLPELTEAADVEMGEENTSIMDTEDEEPRSNRSLRRGNDRAMERKRKRDEEEERRLKAIEAKQTKGTREYQKVLKKVEQTKDRIAKDEAAIISLDEDLREADCPRTRVLGKDRFWNRYYWFERNAMPYEGLPDASTADAEYANGRLWVQGPDDLEREGFIDVNAEERSKYFHSFQMTPAERKRLEEGPTSVFTAREWGYYENTEDIIALLAWLEPRGNREIKLRKELALQREVIAKYMQKRKDYLARETESDREPSPPPPPPPPTTRMSTRTTRGTAHTNRDKEPQLCTTTTTTTTSRTHYCCLRWRNGMALRELGHKHMEAPPPPVKTRGAGARSVQNKKGVSAGSAPGSMNRLPLREERVNGRNAGGGGMVTRNRMAKVSGRHAGK
jgi:Williams-Beuren syndrome DDT (WSD), D-TOX E motif